MSSKVKGYVAGVLAAIFYGTNPLGTLYLYQDGISSGSVLFYRYALALVFFAAWMALRGEGFRVRWGHAVRFIVLGSLFGLSSTTLYVSFHYMDAGIASTILFSYPIMTAVLMVAFFHEHVTWPTALSITLATLGIGLLYRGDGSTTLSAVGVALVLLSSLLYALYIIAVNQWTTTYSPVKFTFWIVLGGLLSILAFSLASGNPLQWLHGARQWGCAVQLALLPTVLSLFFMNIAIKNIGSTPSAIMGALEPVTAVFIGCLVFAESFSLRLAIGIVLILSAVILIIVARSDGKPEGDSRKQRRLRFAPPRLRFPFHRNKE
ncbi:MAG TPA: EamA family transporter [Prevotella sp.]|nr:EamA family transporter [Prevotella sp.]